MFHLAPITESVLDVTSEQSDGAFLKLEADFPATTLQYKHRLPVKGPMKLRVSASSFASSPSLI